jgi:DnaK suppressor protein
MTPEERTTLKEKIRDDLDQVRTEIQELQDLTRPISPENAIGRVSRMDAINNKSINDAALRASRKKALMLERALGRAEEPDFGRCARCKQPIPHGRLMLMPHTTRCVHCASR